MRAGQDAALYWRLAPREIVAVLDGAAARARDEHNQLAWTAWHMARLTAYAPEKSAQFPKLDKMLAKAPKGKQGAASKRGWEEDFAALSAWASKGK